MLTSITHSGLYVLDLDEALDFYVGKLGLEVDQDIDMGVMRWLTVRVPSEPERCIVLQVPEVPGQSPETHAQARDLVSKGASAGWLIFAVDDCRRTYEELLAKGVEFSEEPTERFYGTDCALRDPSGNSIRLVQRVEGPIEYPEAGAVA
jgi:catechol 2,3-dioxygenase-like lactoylglutathione lyase family enzyme